MREIHIYDMDGTIVDSSHRYRVNPKTGKIDLEHWRANCTPEKISQDSLLPLAEQYKRQLNDPDIYVVIATARVMQAADWEFVRDVLGMPNKIISRPANSREKGATLKTRGLRFLNNLKQFKGIRNRFFYEDNKDYLYPVAQAIGATPVFIQSNQGF